MVGDWGFMKISVLLLPRVSRIHWEFCCCLDCDLLPVAQICKEEGERFWAFHGFLVWFGQEWADPQICPFKKGKGKLKLTVMTK